MLLAVDIGNSNIVIGASEGEKWIHQWRIETDANRTADEYAMLFINLFDEVGIGFTDFDEAIISSVVPQLSPEIKKIFTSRSHLDPIILNSDLDTGLIIRAENPEEVGADLIADAVAAYDYFKDTCLVVDFGTATTVMGVQPPGELVGGAICAGLKVTVDALVGKAAQLSQIPLELPPSIIGRNTMEAMQSGLVMGHICMVEGIIEEMKKELGELKVVATGGLSELIGAYTDCFDHIEPMLTLNGLRIIARRID